MCINAATLSTYRYNPSAIFIVVGSNSLAKGKGVEYAVTGIIYAPGFDAKLLLNDMVLFKVGHRIHRDEEGKIQPTDPNGTIWIKKCP